MFGEAKQVSVENSPMSNKNYNQVLLSLNSFMVEQTEIGDYNQLVNNVLDQLDKLLMPIAATYNEYDEQNSTFHIKEIKANQGTLDIFLKISENKLFSLSFPADDQISKEIKTERIKLFSTLHEATGGFISKSVSNAVSKAVGINCYLGLSYVIDDQVFGTTVIALRKKPELFMMEPLKTYAYFTSLSLKRILADQALNQSKQELRIISDNIVDLVSLTDVEGKLTFLAGNNLELLGYENEELLGKSVLDLVYKEDLKKIAELFNKHILSGEDGRAEYRVVRKDGNLIWVETVGRILFDNSQVRGALFVTRDISDRKEVEQKLKFQAEILDSIGDLVTATDPEGKILYVNEAECRKFGKTRDELIGKTTDIYGEDPKHGALQKEIVEVTLEKGFWRGEVVNYDKENNPFYLDCRTWGMRDADGAVHTLIGIATDITDNKKAEEKIRHIGFHDQLTDLYNRHYFESCKEELKDISLLSVIMTDVNGLKLINDTYGHGTGDELLRKYADLLRRSFKQSDLIFRWGGDEFIVILKNNDEAISWELCNRLIKHCGETFVKEIPLSISVGISSKLQGGDIDKAIREAEDIMYKNKLIESKSSKSLIMKTLRHTLSEKSFETKEHIDRMTLVGRKFGERLGLSLSELSRLETLTMLHDIGKINIDSHILLKDKALTDEEWSEIKKHPEVGYRITRTTEEFAYIAEDILAHHERWDGKGYPQGLGGENIPYLARILNLIDSYDVMSNGRPYKKKMTAEEIIDEIEQCSGKQFDPNSAKEFIACLKEGLISLEQ
jgi:diguanylate cyclase (GGDEF)-like protein/PAS domain S-box-containing protein